MTRGGARRARLCATQAEVSAARAHAFRFYGAVALIVAAVVVALVLGGRSRTLPALRGASAAPLDVDVADWCPQGFEPLAGGGCYAAPAAAAGPLRGLILYLHGRYAPEAAPEEDERRMRVARLGSARGYAVLALRGLQGQCGDPQLATWWCWPSNEKKLADGPAFVARFERALAEAERRTGKTRRLLLGFSNGGYFAAMIAPRALLPVDAVAIAHAGPVAPMHPVGATPPILLIDADDDPSGPEMDRLDSELTHETWPHAMVAREGGHALPDWDVEMALTFFDRVRSEPLPLLPPLSTRARRMHPPPDAASPPAEEGPNAASTETAAPVATAVPTSTSTSTVADPPEPGHALAPAAPATPDPAPSE